VLEVDPEVLEDSTTVPDEEVEPASEVLDEVDDGAAEND